MQVTKILGTIRSMFGADRVFGEAYEANGVTVIPVAKLSGGGGGGSDDASDDADGTGGTGGVDGERGGGGAGFGIHARPAGALVIEADGTVRWKVPFDLNKVILGGQLVAIAFFVTAWLTERSRAKAAQRSAIAQAAISGVARAARQRSTT
jgi:uncharacterized spore protein YtfJ